MSEQRCPRPSVPVVAEHEGAAQGLRQAGAGGVRVLVADPHCCVREGLKAVLGAQPGLRVVGEAVDGPTALALARDLSPQVVVLEAALPGLDGAQVTARLGNGRGCKVLVLTAREDAGSVRLLLGAGARGYVLKRSPAERLVEAVRAVAAGGAYLDPEAAGSLGAGERPAAELSDREVQVVRLIAQGYSRKEVAVRLKLSPKTIETSRVRAMEKRGLRNRVDIVRYAVRCGWLTEDAPVPHDDRTS